MSQWSSNVQNFVISIYSHTSNCCNKNCFTLHWKVALFSLVTIVDNILHQWFVIKLIMHRVPELQINSGKASTSHLFDGYLGDSHAFVFQWFKPTTKIVKTLLILTSHILSAYFRSCIIIMSDDNGFLSLSPEFVCLNLGT